MTSNSINTNTSSFGALGALRTAQSDLLSATKRTQTGYRVSDATDDAGAFSIAQQVRGDVSGWDVVASAQARGVGAAKVALGGLEKISDLVQELRRRLLEYASDASPTSNSIAANTVQTILNQIDAIAGAARFDGIRPLAAPQVASPGGGVALSGVQTISNATPFIVQSVTISGLPPGTPGTVILQYDNFGVPDTEAVFYRDAQVASSGFTAGTGQLAFNYDGNPPYSFEVLGGTGVGSSANFQAFFVAGAPTANDGSIQLIRDPSGGQSELKAVDASVTGLTLNGASPLPAPPGPYTNILNSIAFAENLIARNMGYFASKIKDFEGVQNSARLMVDSVTRGLGALIDADLGKAQSLAESAKIKQQLALQGVSVANQSQRAILGFLESISQK